MFLMERRYSMLTEGLKAPDFTLPGIDEDGAETKFSLKELRGRKLVLYFYPKDNTPGCTREACDFRDNMRRLKGNAAVLGISPDSVESHKKFREKLDLSYPLLSDGEKTVASAYGAWGEKTMYGKKTFGIIRSTFLIDEKGVLLKAWRKVKVQGHVDEVLGALKG